jgi:hypothetical protein
MTAYGQFSCPPAGSNTAASGQSPAAADKYTGRRVIGWMRRKYRRASWKELRRRYLTNGWWPARDGRDLFDTRKDP